MGPLELLYSWQSLLCAFAVVGIMRMVTAIIDVAYGKEKRKANKVLSVIVLPAVTVVIGGAYAALGGPRPETLLEYAAAHAPGAWAYVTYFAWGAACGQFAQTLYDRGTDLLRKAR